MNLDAMPNPVGFFRDLGAAGFDIADIAMVCGCSRSAISASLKANPAAQTAYGSARRGYEGPGGKRAVLRLGLVEEDVDALIVSGVLHLDQRGNEQSRDCLTRLARRLSLASAPDIDTSMRALTPTIGAV